MEVLRAKDYDEMARKAAAILCTQIRSKPNSVLGLATGSSVLGLYENLIKFHEDENLDFSMVNTVNLDEYIGLSGKNDQSYRYFMDNKLFNHINIKPENTHIPNGLAEDTEAECERYDNLLKDLGGADIQILGLGLNGHIGFNEPGEAFVKEARVVDLAETTIKANSRFFVDESQVPRQAITMGIGGIMSAKRILLCVSGRQKSKILREVLLGEIKPGVPGSILQLHPDLVVVADEDALYEL
jgi:glucosamine-6-phosphate deaminase